MRIRTCCTTLAFLLAGGIAVGQGTLEFIYDQQSSTVETPTPGAGAVLQIAMSAQSFTPTLTSVGFIRVKLSDGAPGGGRGATLIMNLRAESITGTILSSTDPVVLADRFAGVVDFIFPSPVAVTPGVEYYFEPIVQSGDTWIIDTGPYDYPDGTAFYQGLPLVASDLWFREGIVVPEPSAAWLCLVGTVMLACRRRGLRH
jgi:hypothetical protein